VSLGNSDLLLNNKQQETRKITACARAINVKHPRKTLAQVRGLNSAGIDLHMPSHYARTTPYVCIWEEARPKRSLKPKGGWRHFRSG